MSGSYHCRLCRGEGAILFAKLKYFCVWSRQTFPVWCVQLQFTTNLWSSSLKGGQLQYLVLSHLEPPREPMYIESTEMKKRKTIRYRISQHHQLSTTKPRHPPGRKLEVLTTTTTERRTATELYCISSQPGFWCTTCDVCSQFLCCSANYSTVLLALPPTQEEK